MAREVKDLILQFPERGINVVVPRTAQPPDTCVDCQNVRPYDSIDGRSRGGLRPGLTRYLNTAFAGGARIQDINYSTIIANTAPAANTLSYRSTAPMAIANGTIYAFTAANTVTSATASGARTLSNTVPFIYSAELFQRIYIVDGTSYKIWVAGNNTATDWTPSAGSLPGTDGTVAPRLIEMWRGRIVLSGLRTDPHNWFMSKLGDPLDWDYASAPANSLAAVQGGLGTVGKIGDVINCIIPYSDDVLIFGCDHSIWQLSGDPHFGGAIDLISGTVGMAFGRPWCQDSAGTIYFMTSRGSVCTMTGGGGNPVNISFDSIDPLLADINLNTTHVRMVWDEEQNGAYVFLTPFLNSASTVWFYEARKKGWFKDVFSNTSIGPTAVKVFDGDLPGDRVVLLGGRDGYLRYIDKTAVLDDAISNFAINAFVIIGPTMGDQGRKPFILTELQALTDTGSNTIKYEILAGDTPDAALDTATADFTADGTWAAGMGSCENPRTRAYYLYYKIGSNAATLSWAIEQVRSKIEILSHHSGRSRTVDTSITHTEPLQVYTSGAVGRSGAPYSIAWLLHTQSIVAVSEGGKSESLAIPDNTLLIGGPVDAKRNYVAVDTAPDTGTHYEVLQAEKAIYDLSDYTCVPQIRMDLGGSGGPHNVVSNCNTTNFILEFSGYWLSSVPFDTVGTLTTPTGLRGLVRPNGNTTVNTGIYVNSNNIVVLDSGAGVNQVSDQDDAQGTNWIGYPFRRFFIRVNGATTHIWADGVRFSHSSGNTSFTTPTLINTVGNAIMFFAGHNHLTTGGFAFKYFRLWGGVNDTVLADIIASDPPDQAASIWNV